MSCIRRSRRSRIPKWGRRTPPAGSGSSKHPAAGHAGFGSRTILEITTFPEWAGQPTRSPSSCSSSIACRIQIEVIIADVRTGAGRQVLCEKDDAWVEVCDSLIWLDGGRSFTWLSERDGWQHFYRVSRADGQTTLLTPGQFDVMRLERIDEIGGWAYYTASPDNPTQQYLYRVPLDGSGRAERTYAFGSGGDTRIRHLTRLPSGRCTRTRHSTCRRLSSLSHCPTTALSVFL